MRRVRVKICGTKTPEIALAAADAGADAIGLVFAPSRRRVTVGEATRIVAALPPFITPVAVFVDAPEDEVASIVHGLSINTVQLHGEEPPEMCEWLRGQGIRVIKALRVGDALDPAIVERYRAASAILLDTKVDGVLGGTGRTFDWTAARGLAERFRIVVSGGLNSENVTAALDILRPYGVDVSSGVETDDEKDPAKIRNFVDRVRRWEASLERH